MTDISPELAAALPEALAAAEDLIALAEESYNREASPDEPTIDNAWCGVEGVCHWNICQAAGCIVDKFHRGLALQSKVLALSDTSLKGEG